MQCQELDEIFLQFLINGKISRLDRLRARNHLRKCTNCKKLAKKLTSFIELLNYFEVASLDLAQNINCRKYQDLLYQDLEQGTDNKSLLAGHIIFCHTCCTRIPMINCDDFFQILKNENISSYDYLKLHRHGQGCINCSAFLDVDGLRILIKNARKL